MDKGDVHEYVERIKRNNKDLHLLLIDFRLYIVGVEKRCKFPDLVRDYTYKQAGMDYALHCVESILAAYKESGDETDALISLMTYCSRWSCASPYSDDRYADTERAYGENSIKIKIARWIKAKAGDER